MIQFECFRPTAPGMGTSVSLSMVIQVVCLMSFGWEAHRLFNNWFAHRLYIYVYLCISIYLSIYIYNIYIYILIYLSIYIYIIIVYTYIWFAMKVHLGVFDCESLRGSNIRPAEMFSLSLQFLFLNVSRKVHYMDAQWIVNRFDNFALGLIILLSGWHYIASASEVLQQRSFQKWGFARAKQQGPWCLLFVWCAPCWWLGSADKFSFRESFVKVLWRSRWGK